MPSRLASNAGYAGCYSGHVTELAARWLAALSPAELAEVAIYACGPTPMLAATARLARALALPCQLSLEEYMACAVGGCAGLRGRGAHRPGTNDAARLRRWAGVRSHSVYPEN